VHNPRIELLAAPVIFCLQLSLFAFRYDDMEKLDHFSNLQFTDFHQTNIGMSHIKTSLAVNQIVAPHTHKTIIEI